MNRFDANTKHTVVINADDRSVLSCANAAIRGRGRYAHVRYFRAKISCLLLRGLEDPLSVADKALVWEQHRVARLLLDLCQASFHTQGVMGGEVCQALQIEDFAWKNRSLPRLRHRYHHRFQSSS